VVDMKLKLNKKGMSLPAMLAIITFLIGSLLAIITTSINRAQLIERSIDYTEEYVNYTNNIRAVQTIIARDEITDETEIANLTIYFNIQYSQPNPAVYRFYKELDSVNRTVSGYLAESTELIETYDEIFSHDGTDDFELSPLVTSTTMFKEYSKSYISENFPGISLTDEFESLTDFDDIVEFYEDIPNYSVESPSYIRNQVNPVINDYIFIDDDLHLEDKNLTINPGYLLIIDGDLTTEGDVNITGNIVINGDFEITGKKKDNRNIIGTFYVNGDLEIESFANVGTQSRPSFFFVTEEIEVENRVTVYGFFIADEISVSSGTILNGGVYANDELDVNDNKVYYYPIDNQDLDDYGVASSIIVESTSGETTFTYTEPKFE